jgi:hypothetical protein
MLIEIKTDSVHYFVDNEDRRQGEYKEWRYDDGRLRYHCFCVDGKLHGESKSWYVNGKLYDHCFYVGGEVYRDLIKERVTDEEKFLITLETGGKWLC